MNAQETNIPTGRAVLRVTHQVDAAGSIIDVQLEPLPDASREVVAAAAYHAARRSVSFVVGDHAAEQIRNARAIALKQIAELLDASDEMIFTVERDASALAGATMRLRDAAMDLRGYLPALVSPASADALIAQHRQAAHQ